MRIPLALLALAFVGGCSSVKGTALRTGALQLPPHSGPVAIYAGGTSPQGAADLGVVEVHASNQEATVDTLFPLFVQKVALLGGDAAVIDGVRAKFEIVPYGHWETYYYPCGYAMCSGMRYMSARDEVMVVSMYGRAMRLGGAR